MSPWHLAAYRGHVSVLKVLVDVVLHVQDVPMLLTSTLGRMFSMPPTAERLLKMFLQQGCRGGVTPLMLAARGGHTEAVAYLLSIGERSAHACMQTGALNVGQLPSRVQLSQ
jgi:ankyrin repeat protein